MRENKISVVIHTYNAEKYLRLVLDSVKEFDEILICDMYSTDHTIDIAQEYGANIIYHENAGFAEPARTFGIQSAKHEWILTIDADELVPIALKKYLYNLIIQPDCPAGVRIPRKNYFMGRFMRCTYPDYILRFFKKEGTFWPPYVHTQPVVEGLIRNIPRKMKDLAFIHLANDSAYTNLHKTNIYTENEKIKRKNKKYGYFSLMNQTLFRFLKLYFLKGAIWDGKAGLAYAGLIAFYKYMTITKVWESNLQYDEVLKDSRKALKDDM